MKAQVNDACVGCGVCAGACPDVFEMGDNNIAVVKVDPIPPQLEECTKQAAKDCPVEAIIIEE